MDKPFAGPDDQNSSTCWDCGHSWPCGTDGTHSCTTVLQARLAGAWQIAHQGNPCILCGLAQERQWIGGCTATPRQIWSAIGNLVDGAQALFDEGGRDVEARALEEKRNLLRRLHDLMGRVLFPVVPPKEETFLSVCEASVVYTDFGISGGMKLGIAAARQLGIPIEFRSLYGTACRGCGCTDDNCMECVELTGEPCSWVEPGLCSACTDEPPFGLCECDPPVPDKADANPLAHPEGCPYRELALRNRRVAELRRQAA